MFIVAPPPKISDIKDFRSSVNNSHSVAFTLAEIISVTLILGIVAVMTISSVHSNSTIRANKTKIRKAMAAYETAVNKMIIENDIPRSQTDLKEFMSSDNCVNATKYFKIMEKENPDSNCRFRTSDKLWWDIEDITNTIVSFEKEDLNWVTAGGGEFKAFKFVTRFDPNGSLRINDMGFSNPQLSYDVGIAYKEAIKKIWAYLNNESYLENIFAKYSKSCFDEIKNYRCTTSNQACRGCTSQWDRGAQYATGNYWGQYLSHVYDENGNEVAYMWHCQPGTNECSSNSTNGLYVKREDGLYIECYNCDNTFTKPAGDTFVQLQKREGDNVTCSCTGCEFAKYRNDGGKINPNCNKSRACAACKGSGCPALSDDGCYHL